MHHLRQWLPTEFLFAHADSVDTIQKLFQTALSDAVLDFTIYTFAIMVSQLGWLPDLTHVDVLTHLVTLR
jgi:hypothetical protein